MQVVIVIPFKNFKEKIKITKKYERKGQVVAEKNYVMIDLSV